MRTGSLNLIAVIFCLTLAAACDRGTDFSFDTYGEAKQDTSVRGASLPDFLPSSSTKIKGWYSVELNEQIIEFSYSKIDETRFLTTFSPLSGAEEVVARKDFDNYRWAHRNLGASLRFFKRMVNGRIEHLAIDGTNAYWWSTPL